MKRHTQKQLIHLFAGLLIVGLAFYFFEREDVLQATILFGSGCVFLILAGAHTWIEKNIRRISSYFFFLEAATFYYAAKHYQSLGHEEPCRWLLAASILFVLLAILYLVTKKRTKSRSRSRKKNHDHHNEF